MTDKKRKGKPLIGARLPERTPMAGQRRGEQHGVDDLRRPKLQLPMNRRFPVFIPPPPPIVCEDDVTWASSDSDDETDDDEDFPPAPDPNIAGGSRRRKYDYSSTASAKSVTVAARRGTSDRFTSVYHDDDEETVYGKKKKRKKRARDMRWVLTCKALGGPEDPSVIPSFRGHVAYGLWLAPERRGMIQFCSGGKGFDAVKRYVFVGSSAWEVVKASGLFHLRECMMMHDRLDLPLLAAFVERWQPDTNTFHMPFGEMTILLHDVFYILRIPVDGELLGDRGGECSLSPKDDMCNLLELTMDELLGFDDIGDRKGVPWYNGEGLLADEVLSYFHKHEFENRDSEAQCYLLCLLGFTLFGNKSGDRVSVATNVFLRDHQRVRRYAWGAGTLAYLYRQLGLASRADCNKLYGCLTLLQTWIYEYFPSLRPTRCEPPTPTDGEPFALRWKDFRPGGEHMTAVDRLDYYRMRLDKLKSHEVNWLPYRHNPGQAVPRSLYDGVIRFGDVAELYAPLRCLRQFGYRQVVPDPVIVPRDVYRPASGVDYVVTYDRHFLDQCWNNRYGSRIHLDVVSAPAQPLWEADEDYIGWYFKHSHPFIFNSDCAGYADKLAACIVEGIRPVIMADDDKLSARLLEHARSVRGLYIEYDRKKALKPPQKVAFLPFPV